VDLTLIWKVFRDGGKGGLAGDMAPPPTWHHIIPLPHYLASYKTLSYISPKRTHREVHFEREILHMWTLNKLVPFVFWRLLFRKPYPPKSIYIYIYIYECVCYMYVCVCGRERESPNLQIGVLKCKIYVTRLMLFSGSHPILFADIVEAT
jgi:hypothetical protein